MNRLSISIASLIALAIPMTACSHSEKASIPTMSPSASVASSTPQELSHMSSSPSAESERSSNDSTPSPSDRRGIPSAAIELPVVYTSAYDGGEYASLKTPSGNIGCDFSRETAGCGVMSYLTDKPYGSDGSFPRWWFNLVGDIPQIGSKGDIPIFGEPSLDFGKPYILNYGESAFFGRTACSSEEKGLTCWNIDTGHGIFLSREEYRSF